MEEERVTLVVCGKKFPNISKSALIDSSLYFKVLFNGNFNEHSKNTFCFHRLSTSAFEMILEYILESKVILRGKNRVKIESAVEIADFLCIDGFLLELKRKLVTQWTDLESSEALALCSEFGVTDEMTEFSLKRAEAGLKVWPLSYHGYVNDFFSYEMLIFVTGKECFWQSPQCSTWHYCYDFFFYLSDILSRIFKWALRNPPHMRKLKELVRNLKLHSLPWNNIIRLFIEMSQELNRKYIVKAVQFYFMTLRQEIIRRVSSIRTSVVFERKKTSKLLLVEFNLLAWTWQVKEIESKFTVKHSIMSRDYTNFFGDQGILIFKRNCHRPKHIKNLYIKELFNLVPYVIYERAFISSCVGSKWIYFLVRKPRDYFEDNSLWYRQPTLFRINVFTYGFEECATVSVVEASIKCHGNLLYVVGLDKDDLQKMKVLCYDTKSNELTNVAEYTFSEDFSLHVGRHEFQSFIVIKKRILYVFFKMNFVEVDTTKSVHQTLEIKALESFFTQGRHFYIIQAVSVYDGVIFLIDVKHNAHNCLEIGVMVAHFNTDTKKFQSLGFLPRLEELHCFKNTFLVEGVPEEKCLAENNDEIVDGMRLLEKCELA